MCAIIVVLQNVFTSPYIQGISFSGYAQSLVMRFYGHGSLRDFLDLRWSSGASLTWAERLAIARDIAQGMAYLHGRPDGEVGNASLPILMILTIP